MIRHGALVAYLSVFVTWPHIHAEDFIKTTAGNIWIKLECCVENAVPQKIKDMVNRLMSRVSKLSNKHENNIIYIYIRTHTQNQPYG